MALDAVDLALQPGQLTAVLGPNGAGKTTAVRLMLGTTRPTAGRALLFGLDPAERQAREGVGVMLQVGRVPETLTPREHLALFSSYYANPLPLATTLDLAGIGEVADRRFGTLSGGQKQRVLFAAAICGNPRLLFLDEPTVGLDIESRHRFWDAIRALIAQRRSVLLTTHYLEEADALADRVVLLRRGRIVADGTPDSVKQAVAGRRVRCVTSVAADELRTWPGVASVTTEGNAIVALASDAEGLVRRLFARDAALSGLEVSGIGLEEAFVALTGDERSAA
jgi:ABC-2 type transport system ATP-binding protein